MATIFFKNNKTDETLFSYHCPFQADIQVGYFCALALRSFPWFVQQNIRFDIRKDSFDRDGKSVLNVKAFILGFKIGLRDKLIKTVEGTTHGSNESILRALLLIASNMGEALYGVAKTHGVQPPVATTAEQMEKEMRAARHFVTPEVVTRIEDHMRVLRQELAHASGESLQMQRQMNDRIAAIESNRNEARDALQLLRAEKQGLEQQLRDLFGSHEASMRNIFKHPPPPPPPAAAAAASTYLGSTNNHEDERRHQEMMSAMRGIAAPVQHHHHHQHGDDSDAIAAKVLAKLPPHERGPDYSELLGKMQTEGAATRAMLEGLLNRPEGASPIDYAPEFARMHNLHNGHLIDIRNQMEQYSREISVLTHTIGQQQQELQRLSALTRVQNPAEGVKSDGMEVNYRVQMESAERAHELRLQNMYHQKEQLEDAHRALAQQYASLKVEHEGQMSASAHKAQALCAQIEGKELALRSAEERFAQEEAALIRQKNDLAAEHREYAMEKENQIGELGLQLEHAQKQLVQAQSAPPPMVHQGTMEHLPGHVATPEAHPTGTVDVPHPDIGVAVVPGVPEATSQVSDEMGQQVFNEQQKALTDFHAAASAFTQLPKDAIPESNYEAFMGNRGPAPSSALIPKRVEETIEDKRKEARRAHRPPLTVQEIRELDEEYAKEKLPTMKTSWDYKPLNSGDADLITKAAREGHLHGSFAPPPEQPPVNFTSTGPTEFPARDQRIQYTIPSMEDIADDEKRAAAIRKVRRLAERLGEVGLPRTYKPHKISKSTRKILNRRIERDNQEVMPWHPLGYHNNMAITVGSGLMSYGGALHHMNTNSRRHKAIIEAARHAIYGIDTQTIDPMKLIKLSQYLHKGASNNAHHQKKAKKLAYSLGTKNGKLPIKIGTNPMNGITSINVSSIMPSPSHATLPTLSAPSIERKYYQINPGVPHDTKWARDPQNFTARLLAAKLPDADRFRLISDEFLRRTKEKELGPEWDKTKGPKPHNWDMFMSMKRNQANHLASLPAQPRGTDVNDPAGAQPSPASRTRSGLPFKENGAGLLPPDDAYLRRSRHNPHTRLANNLPNAGSGLARPLKMKTLLRGGGFHKPRTLASRDYLLKKLNRAVQAGTLHPCYRDSVMAGASMYNFA